MIVIHSRKKEEEKGKTKGEAPNLKNQKLLEYMCGKLWP